jgi:hypothetical protein
MPFNRDTKTRMFVRCARVCCLCFKQCGTNIEAAHIVGEADGGPNTEDNGIPVCMDCHTEIGHYNDAHPKGNKFTPEELRSRRDQVYTLMESGVLQALIIAGQAHHAPLTSSHASASLRKVPSVGAMPKPSKAAKQVFEAAKAGTVRGESFPRKLDLLGPQDQAYVLDRLLEHCDEGENLAALMAVLASGLLGDERTLVIVEQVLRSVTLANDCSLKARFMELVPVELLKATEEGLRIAFFTEAISIMHANQYSEVNDITPAIPKAQDAIPNELKAAYVSALLSQVDSGAWHGAPAARRALAELPDGVATHALAGLELEYLRPEARRSLLALLTRTKHIWPKPRKALFSDFTTMPWRDFTEKHLLAD